VLTREQGGGDIQPDKTHAAEDQNFQSLNPRTAFSIFRAFLTA
jgi:hypothetical protein